MEVEKQIIEHNNIFLSRIPSSEMYFRSYLHRDEVQFVAASPIHQFLITMSFDGVIKFWHLFEDAIEAVKQIKTQDGAFHSFSVSHDEEFIATGSKNGKINVFRIPSFEMVTKIDFLRPDSVNVCFIDDPSDPICQLALSFSSKGDIIVIDPFEKKNADQEPSILRTIKFHRVPLSCMSFSNSKKMCISVDQSGIIEFWDAKGNNPTFQYKSRFDTDLFDIAKFKLMVSSISMSKDGSLFALCCTDWKIRVFNINTGKIVLTIDDPIDGSNTYGLDTEYFNSRVELELRYRSSYSFFSAVFDETGTVLMCPSSMGIRFISIPKGNLLRIIGSVEKQERFNTIASLTSITPMIIVAAFEKQRFYLFTNKSPEDHKRDIMNEKENLDKMMVSNKIRRQNLIQIPRIAILHTMMGSIKFEMFVDECPLTCENFYVHAKRGYFDNIRIHRIVRDFCIQTGDPTGKGIGGESIWGGNFEDEISENSHKFDQPGMVGMANEGRKNTNGSQFFITTVATPNLNGKHTCWGKVIEGMENVKRIELVEIDGYNHPLKPLLLVNVTFCSK